MINEHLIYSERLNSSTMSVVRRALAPVLRGFNTPVFRQCLEISTRYPEYVVNFFAGCIVHSEHRQAVVEYLRVHRPEVGQIKRIVVAVVKPEEKTRHGLALAGAAVGNVPETLRGFKLVGRDSHGFFFG